MKYQFYIKTSVIECEDNQYGLLVKEGENIERIANITRDKDKLKRLSEKINRGEVSRMHIYDIIEDFLE